MEPRDGDESFERISSKLGLKLLLVWDLDRDVSLSWFGCLLHDSGSDHASDVFESHVELLGLYNFSKRGTINLDGVENEVLEINSARFTFSFLFRHISDDWFASGAQLA